MKNKNTGGNTASHNDTHPAGTTKGTAATHTPILPPAANEQENTQEAHKQKANNRSGRKSRDNFGSYKGY